jgi:hypothetical protein
MEKVPQTLAEFIQLTGSKMRIFDMGRRICEISDYNFATFEQAQTAYPYPFQQQALFGIVLWNESKKDEQSIWFLKFPLDEMGLLIQVARDDFLNRLLEKAILNSDRSKQGEEMDAALKDNPYSFTPSPERMAVFHAKVAQALGNPVSHYHGHAEAYFKGDNGYDQWQFVGIQGVADITSRLHGTVNEKVITDSIQKLPIEPFSALSSCLEHETVGPQLTKEVAQCIATLLGQQPINVGEVALYIRAIAGSTDKLIQRKSYQAVLESSIGAEAEILASISGRAWESLEDPTLLSLFLERLAESGQGCFKPLLTDLLCIPSMRLLVLQAIRSANCSDRLTTAVGELFKKKIKTAGV